jgi:H+-transporting ATPase
MDIKELNIQKAKELPFKTVFKKLMSERSGLSTSEAKKRLDQFGFNEISEKKINPIQKFLSYFWGPIPWMIEIAMIISASIGHMEEFWVILVLLLVNAIVGFWQEQHADNAIQLLKQKLALNAKVQRDSKWVQLPAKELVPGDVVHVRLGDRIPADIKLVDGDYLMLDESALTGESLPIEKNVEDIGFAGSIVRQGEMDAVVVSTGMNTFFGKTAKLVEEAKTESHFQKAVVKIGDYLIILAVALVALIFIIGLFRQESILDILQFALVLTVAAIPVALPAVLSVAMAVGAMALAKKKAIVSKLVAIEEMAGVDVLCSDKTGTITKNELTVVEIIKYDKFTNNDILLSSVLASKMESQDTIDNAIITRARKLKVVKDSIDQYKILKFKPFDPVIKRTEAEVEDANGHRFKVAKGAPQSILGLFKNEEHMNDRINANVNAFAVKGYRALGVARTDPNGSWQYLGLIALSDPPREDSSETIKTAQAMGIKVKMVTGDHTAIAKEISKQVGLGSNIVPASSFMDKPDREIKTIVENADGFSEVYPEHKYHIVELMQKKDHIVGMTGDGVNDAPALKKADVGIAVHGSTDAAKSAASIVLTKPGLSVIIDAVKQSRQIFQRMTNYSIYRITETIRVLFFITFSIIIFQFYPVTALMIVLLAILNDAPIMTIAYDNVKYRDKPEKWDMQKILSISTVLGIIGVFESFIVLYIGLDYFNLGPDVLQSFIYLKLSVSGHLIVFAARTKGPFWSVKPALPLFAAVVVTQLVATLITVYGFLLPAMGWNLAIFIWVEALIVFVIVDIIKVRVYDVLDHGGIKFYR